MQWKWSRSFPLRSMARSRQAAGGWGHVSSADEPGGQLFQSSGSRFCARRMRHCACGKLASENFITYKGPQTRCADQNPPRNRAAARLPAAQAFEQFVEALGSAGFRRVVTVHKQREPGLLNWDGQNGPPALDHVGGLGQRTWNWKSLADDSSLEPAKVGVMSLATRLGISPSERSSYLELLLSRNYLRCSISMICVAIDDIDDFFSLGPETPSGARC